MQGKRRQTPTGHELTGNEEAKTQPSGKALVSTRREFLSIALAAGSVVVAVLPPQAAAQGSAGGNPGQPLRKIGELRSQGGKLRGVVTTRSRTWSFGDPMANLATAERGMRYFKGEDAASGLAWPPADATGPLPGPTLRASVGDKSTYFPKSH